LPGYGRPLPGRHYSGYVTTPYPGRPGVVVHTHYYLALHADEDAPLVQWQPASSDRSVFSREFRLKM